MQEHFVSKTCQRFSASSPVFEITNDQNLKNAIKMRSLEERVTCYKNSDI